MGAARGMKRRPASMSLAGGDEIVGGVGEDDEAFDEDFVAWMSLVVRKRVF